MKHFGVKYLCCPFDITIKFLGQMDHSKGQFDTTPSSQFSYGVILWLKVILYDKLL
jgi:hypothetical protein